MTNETMYLLDPDRVAAIDKRVPIFLDTNIWIDLGEAKNEEAKKCRDLLLTLVNEKLAFCPLSFTIIAELFLQGYDSAARQAELMEQLSLNLTFRTKNEIFNEEVWQLVAAFQQDKLEEAPVQLTAQNLFAPVAAFAGGKLNLDYPTDAPADFIEKMSPIFSDAMKNLGLSQMVTNLKNELPADEWKSEGDPTEYSEVWKERRIATKGNRSAATVIERNSIIENELIPRLLETIKAIPVVMRSGTLNGVETFINNYGEQAGERLINKLPAMDRFVVISTVTGLNDSRKSSWNDSMDIENMIVPPIYAGVFVARDRWVRQILTEPTVQKTNQAIYLFSLNDLISYCSDMLDI